MARGPAVPVKGVWLRRIGDHVIVSVEAEDGRDVEVIREWWDGSFSHNVSEHGLRDRIGDGAGSSVEQAARCVLDTFKKDEAQGYRSRDRQFAIEVLGKAFADGPSPGGKND